MMLSGAAGFYFVAIKQSEIEYTGHPDVVQEPTSLAYVNCKRDTDIEGRFLKKS